MENIEKDFTKVVRDFLDNLFEEIADKLDPNEQEKISKDSNSIL